MKLVVDKESLVSVADAIRTKGNTTDELEFPNGFVDGINAIESGGGGTEEIENLIDQSGVLDSTDGTATEKVEQLIDKAEDEKLWYKTSERLTNITAFFANSNLICPPKSNFINGKSANLFAQAASFEYIDYYLDLKSSNVFQKAFYGCRKLKTMVGINTSKGVDMREVFYGCVELETIQEPLNLGSATNCQYMFYNTPKLTNISFVEETIKVSIEFPSAVLSAESIQSIIDGLATVETAQTLTLNATVKAKLTEEQLATITNKNWNLA